VDHLINLHVSTEPISLGKRIARTVFAVACAALAVLLVHYFWHFNGRKGFDRSEWFPDVVVAGIVTFLFESRRREYDLEVDDEEIRMRGGALKLGNRKVRRGRIRYSHESWGNIMREAGLRLSEHGRIGSFFSGYVWIPATLPEYEQIKAKVMTWMEIG
jgi:uncharacterized membrane-anchored protein